ncbi:MAG: metallophosphoesterase family protein [Desulforhopalus sp.]
MKPNTIFRLNRIPFSRRQFMATALLLLGGRLLPWGSQRAVAGLDTPGRMVRFGVLADPHVDIRGTNGWRMGAVSVVGLEKAVAALNAARLDFVLVPGDLLADGEWENVQVAKQLLDGLTAPYYVVSGNHDYRPADPTRLREGFTYLHPADFIGVFHGHGYGGDGRRHWSQLVAPGLRLIGLDGCLPDEPTGWGGELPAQQLQWLEKQLADSPEPVLIMVHHCLLHWGNDGRSVAGRWYSLENSPVIRRLLSHYREKIIMVISAHRHIGLHHRLLAGVPYFVVPSINSYPMRLSLFTLQTGKIGWTTPSLGVDEALHSEAREGLLRTRWFAGIDDAARRELLRFYENDQYRSGVLARKIAYAYAGQG